jgi:hypothetical protein
MVILSVATLATTPRAYDAAELDVTKAFTLHNGAPLVKVSAVLIQTGDDEMEKEDDGSGFTVIVCEAVDGHPKVGVPVTV